MTEQELRELSVAAEKGDAFAQTDLGMCYFRGDGVPKDMEKATEWFRKAADQGEVDAQCILAECCIYGFGVKVNDKEAVAWFEKAAAQGDERAIEELQKIKDGTKLRILNMVLRKEFALEIVAGKKVREYRDSTDYWVRRLCILENPDDTYNIKGYKVFDRVHFYPYNNRWFVDCTLTNIELVDVDEAFLKEYHDEIIAPVGTQLFVLSLGEVVDYKL